LLKDETLFARRGRRVPRSVLALFALMALALFSINALAETGAEIYKAKCAACHAASGAGDTMLGKNMKLRALGSPDVQKQSDQELATIISRGKNSKNRMPAYERRLTKDQIAAVVRYIRTLKP
jgi:mono/diheme cytochrome c family protein